LLGRTHPSHALSEPLRRAGQALFLFLKFISSVIPTVEYDFTMDFDT